MDNDIAKMSAAHDFERYTLYRRFLNEQMVRVIKTLGFDVGFCRGSGQYLYDHDDNRYLDLLSGFGVFAIGRNHPRLRDTLKTVLNAEMANLVQMDVSALAGILAQRLLKFAPYLDKVFFTNSGTEAVEAAIKFARASTGRPGIVYCEHGFHGLTMGALSINGDRIFRDGFEPLLPECVAVPFNDLEALDRALWSRTVAAFIVEPIQGKGVNLPDEGYLRSAVELCRRYGTLFVTDEIQTGLGRTGRFFAIEHWSVEPDMLLVAKALSGGHVPIGAVLMRKHIHDQLFNRMDRAVVHGSTFAKNDLAMAAGIATLDVLSEEHLTERAALTGQRLLRGLAAMQSRFEMLTSVRGKGLMIGIEFSAPQSLKLKASWTLLERVSVGLFCQMIVIPLFKDHKILCQVAGHSSHTIKLLPPLVIDDEDCDTILSAFDAVIADAHNLPSAVLSLAQTLIRNSARPASAR